MKKITRNKDFLITLSKCKNKMKKAMLSNATKDQLDSICECALNINNGNVPLNPTQFKKFKPYRKTIKKLIDKKINKKEKINQLIKTGGFLNLLIPAIASILGAVIPSLIPKSE